jgi:ankyrin repeat protein
MDVKDMGKEGLPPTPETFERLRAEYFERKRFSIHGSAIIGDLSRVQELLDEGIDVNAPDVHGETALVWAGLYGRTEILQLLIERGADITAESLSAARALHGAAICGHPDTVCALLNAGVSANAWCPAEHVNSAIPQPDGSVAFKYANHEGSTALHGAVAHRHTDVVRVLIEYDADVNAVEGEGRTPWLLSSRARKHAEIRELLKAAGALAT